MRYQAALYPGMPHLTRETPQGRTEVGAKLPAGLAYWPVRAFAPAAPMARQPSRKHHILTPAYVAVAGT